LGSDLRDAVGVCQAGQGGIVMGAARLAFSLYRSKFLARHGVGEEGLTHRLFECLNGALRQQAQVS